MAKLSRNDNRVARHERVRKYISGTPEVPRLCVFRSSKNIYAQIIDNVNGKTLAAASTLDKDIKAECEYGGNKAAAKLVGEKIGKVAVEVSRYQGSLLRQRRIPLPRKSTGTGRRR